MEIKAQIDTARGFFREAGDTLRGAGYGREAGMMTRILTMSLPLFVEASEKTPVHHTACVVKMMARILLGEDASPAEIRRGVVAALLHDVGLARVAAEKMRKADILAAAPDRREAVIERAIAARRAHMVHGAWMAETVLTAFNGWFGEGLSPEDVAEVCRLVALHDNPSVQEYEEMRGHRAGATWLLSLDDRLAMFLREADRLWMLTEEGIAADLELDLQKEQKALAAAGRDPQDARPDREARIAANIARHREEAALYERALGGGAAAYGFINGTLYRTRTGYALFESLIPQRAQSK